ncbi:MAG: HAD family hydrolase [Thermoplasmata archaeon]
MTIRALTIDVYGTLLQDARTPLLQISHDIVERYGLPMGPEEFLGLWEERFFALQQRGFLRMMDANLLSLEDLFRSLRLEGGPEGFVQRVVESWASRPAYPEVKKALRKLEGWPVVLVTNADDETLTEALRTSGLDFPLIVTSESVRAYKPHPRPFRRAVRLLSLKAGEVLHVGDSLLDDVGGAKALGLKTAWVNRDGLELPGEGPRPDFVLSSLDTLPQILPQRYDPGGH